MAMATEKAMVIGVDVDVRSGELTNLRVPPLFSELHDPGLTLCSPMHPNYYNLTALQIPIPILYKFQKVGTGDSAMGREMPY